VQPFYLDDSTTSTKQTVGSYPIFSPVDVLPFCYRKSWIWQESENQNISRSTQVSFNHLPHLAIERIGVSRSPRRRRGTFGSFVHAWEKVDGIIRGSSGAF
jgi:hypothetical protein